LHIDQGSDITVQVTNDGDAAATVDWHGLRLDNRHDGVPNEAQAPIPIGRTFTCRLRVPWRRFLLVPPAQICLLCTGWVCIHLAAAPAQFGGYLESFVYRAWWMGVCAAWTCHRRSFGSGRCRCHCGSAGALMAGCVLWRPS
jgi:hypothetical protein